LLRFVPCNLEFGGRNITEPNEEHVIQPDIANQLPQLSFPSARVSVLSPLRTFWEKTTLMYVACQRPELRVSSERLSRHWYSHHDSRTSVYGGF
jgi:Nucleotidyl transferase AbiEii toxin, Type IV TA system